MTSSPQERAAGIAPNPAASPGSAVPRGRTGRVSSPSAPVLGGLATPTSQSPRVPRSAAPGTPGPVTAARGLRGVSAVGRGRRASGGGAPDTSVPPPGSRGRAYTIVLPAGLKLLSLNDRLHWAAANSIKQELKKAAWAMALHDKVPRLDRVFVAAVYQPPPDWRERDGDNPVISVKACIDGIVAAGILPSDACPRYVTGVYCTIGEPFPAGRMVLHLLPSDPVRELAALAGLRGVA